MVRRLLLVDDDHDFVTILGDRLKSAGYEVVVARNGLEALELLQANLPHIAGVLLDVQMPIMGGLETLREMTRRHSAIRVLMMSTVSPAMIVHEAMRLGARGFIKKSQDLSVFVTECAKAFEGES